MSLYADTQTIEVGGTTSVIYAEALDQNSESIGEGYSLRFTITAGPALTGPESPSFEYVSSEDSTLLEMDAVTDIAGIASVVLYSGSAPGPVTIRVSLPDNVHIFSEEHLVTILAGGAVGIILTADDPELEAGGQSTIVHAAVVDEFGNGAGEGIGVRLVMTGYPGSYGAQFPSFEYPASEDSLLRIFESSTGNDGGIEVDLYPGYSAGQVVIEASLTENSDVSIEEPLVLILPASPYNLYLSYGGPITPVNDSLYIRIAVGVWDRYGNPAGIDTPVRIEIDPDSIVSFESPIYPDSDRWPNTTLGYTCDHYLETIRIIVSAGEVSDTSDLFALPVYHGDIFIIADPGNIWISPPDTAGYSDITVQLLDGLGCQISGGVIYFESLSCGEISGQAIDTTDNNGYAYTEFMIRIDDIPGPPPDPPQCIGLVRVYLLGYPDVADEVEIVCSKPR